MRGVYSTQPTDDLQTLYFGNDRQFAFDRQDHGIRRYGYGQLLALGAGILQITQMADVKEVKNAKG